VNKALMGFEGRAFCGSIMIIDIIPRLRAGIDDSDKQILFGLSPGMEKGREECEGIGSSDLRLARERYISPVIFQQRKPSRSLLTGGQPEMRLLSFGHFKLQITYNLEIIRNKYGASLDGTEREGGSMLDLGD
jgi:hypothetical protein